MQKREGEMLWKFCVSFNHTREKEIKEMLLAGRTTSEMPAV